MPFSSNGSYPCRSSSSRPNSYLRRTGLFLIVAFYFLFGFALPGHAQTLTSDTVHSDTSASALREVYMRTVGPASLLYTGVQYIRNGQKTQGFPFFQSDEPLPGTVWINGLPYPGLALQFDLVTDQLILPNPAGTALFVIEPSLVDSFTIDGTSFVSTRRTGANAVMRPGYYEYLRAGAMTLYIRREKQLQNRSGYDLSAYIDYDRIYIARDGIVHPVRNRRELTDLFADKKDAVKKFLRSDQVNYNKRPVEAVEKLFRQYNSPGL